MIKSWFHWCKWMVYILYKYWIIINEETDLEIITVLSTLTQRSKVPSNRAFNSSKIGRKKKSSPSTPKIPSTNLPERPLTRSYVRDHNNYHPDSTCSRVTLGTWRKRYLWCLYLVLPSCFHFNFILIFCYTCCNYTLLHLNDGSFSIFSCLISME